MAIAVVGVGSAVTGSDGLGSSMTIGGVLPTVIVEYGVAVHAYKGVTFRDGDLPLGAGTYQFINCDFTGTTIRGTGAGPTDLTFRGCNLANSAILFDALAGLRIDGTSLAVGEPRVVTGRVDGLTIAGPDGRFVEIDNLVFKSVDGHRVTIVASVDGGLVTNCQLENLTLTGEFRDFSILECGLDSMRAVGVSFIRSALKHCQLVNVFWESVKAHKLDMSETRTTGGQITDCDLNGANITYGVLTNLDLARTILAGVDFTGTTLEEVRNRDVANMHGVTHPRLEDNPAQRNSLRHKLVQSRVDRHPLVSKVVAGAMGTVVAMGKILSSWLARVAVMSNVSGKSAVEATADLPDVRITLSVEVWRPTRPVGGRVGTGSLRRTQARVTELPVGTLQRLYDVVVDPHASEPTGPERMVS